jgi:hypothetical protein
LSRPGSGLHADGSTDEGRNASADGHAVRGHPDGNPARSDADDPARRHRDGSGLRNAVLRPPNSHAATDFGGSAHDAHANPDAARKGMTMNAPGKSQVAASALRWGVIALFTALLVIGWGYADNDSSRVIVKNVLVAVTPILGGAFGFGFYDGRRAVLTSRGKAGLKPYDVGYHLRAMKPTILPDPSRPDQRQPTARSGP